MALDTPHLVASLCLVDSHVALGARAGVVPQQPDSVQIVLLAFMLRVAIQSLVLVAIWTEKVLAHPTLVG